MHKSTHRGFTAPALIVLIALIALGVAIAYRVQKNTAPSADPSPAIAQSDTRDKTGANADLAATGVYIEYSPENYEQFKDHRRILFFYASWCPTCKAANQDFLTHASEIPAGVVLLKTDYDTEKELKAKYAITYQHTFVQVDAKGNELTKWNGGGFTELTKNALIACENFRYHNCPVGCQTMCVSSFCGDGYCTEDCNGPLSCFSPLLTN